MNHFPKISIVTPSFNQGQFLEETIKSVIEQNYPNLEYIIIDGGSTDNSIEIINNYKNFLKYWESKNDLGQANAINKGLMKSTGDIISYLNSDDRYIPNIFFTMSEIFRLNSNYKWIAGNVLFTDYKGEIITRKKPLFSPYILHFGSSSLYQPSVFLKKEIISEIGLLNESFHAVMDQEWFCRISEKYYPLIVDIDFSYFRWHEKSKSSSSKKSAYYKRLIEEKRIIITKYQPFLKFFLSYYPKLTINILEQIGRVLKTYKRLFIKRYIINNENSSNT